MEVGDSQQSMEVEDVWSLENACMVRGTIACGHPCVFEKDKDEYFCNQGQRVNWPSQSKS